MIDLTPLGTRRSVVSISTFFVVSIFLAEVSLLSDELVFVESGVPKSVIEKGEPWKRGAGYLEQQGEGNLLLADAIIEPGDFEIRMQLELKDLSKSAASFCFDNRSHIGFQGATGLPFLQGPLFGDETIFLDDLKGKFPEDQTFQLEIRRKGERLQVGVDQQVIWEGSISAERLGTFGLRPWRSTMRVVEFSATGNLVRYSEHGDWARDLTRKPVDVFRSGTEDYHTFRIPALITTADGTLLAFAEGRKSSRSDTGNIDLLVKRSTDGGVSWSQPIVIWDDAENTCGNPTPVLDTETGRVWLAMTWNLGTDHERAIMQGTSRFPRLCFLTYSDDNGLTWAKPTEMPHLRKDHWRWYATGPDKGIQLTQGPHRGRLVIPCNHSDHQDSDAHPYRSHVVFSDDHGKTWQLGGVVGEKTNESTLVELADGNVMDNMRSYHGMHRRAISISSDGGESWGSLSLDPTLVEPVCQASLLRLNWPGEGQTPGRIIFSNPASTSREKLTLRTSFDDGESWAKSRCVYFGSAAYSCLAGLPNNTVGVLFERDDYTRITFVAVTTDWLEADAD